MTYFVFDRRLLPMLLAVCLIVPAGCGEEPAQESAVRETAAPPSIREAAVEVAPVVRLTSEQASDLGVRTVRIEPGVHRYSISIPGTVHPAPDHVALVSAPISGRVVRVYAHEGEAVRRGEVLADLESTEYASMVADYMQARADEQYQRQQVSRFELLVERKISPRSALEKGEAELLRANAWVQAAGARLRVLGVTEAQIEEILEGTVDRPLLAVRAPLDGVIDRHLIDLGQAVTAYEQMLSIVNPAEVLVRGYISPEEAFYLQPGTPVRITMKELPGRAIQAAVATINPALDEENRSVTVNIHARTQGGWPVPGQSVRLEVMAESPDPVLMIPLSAVQYEEQNATVFVRKDSLTFEKRTIEISRISDQEVIVASGLREGDEVATSQIFSLKALGRFERYAEE